MSRARPAPTKRARPRPETPTAGPGEATREYYEVRLRHALEHLDRNLHRRVPLSELARVSGFAPFHFHRVFKSMLGQTAADYAKQTRLERAAFLLKYGDARRSLTDLALELGFSESADFSRAFRQQFGMAPSAFRRKPLPARRTRTAEKRERPWAVPPITLAQNKDGFRVEVATEPPLRLAYHRVHGSYDPQRLMAGLEVMKAWVAQQGIREPLLGMSEDDPDLVPAEKCRYDWCVPIPDDLTPAGKIGLRVLEGGWTARMRVQGDFHVTARAWDWLFQVWLPSSGYEPRNAPAREHYLDHGRDAPARFDLLYVLPVRPLQAAPRE